MSKAETADTQLKGTAMSSITRRPGEGEAFIRDNRTVTIKVDLPELSIHEVDFEPSFEVAPHTHGHVDTLYVVEGQIEILGDEEPQILGPGALHAAPTGVKHGFRNPGPGRATVLVFHAPDGGFSNVIRQTTT